MNPEQNVYFSLHPFLQAPNVLVLANGGADRDALVDHVLDNAKLYFGGNVDIYLIDALTSTFNMSRFHSSNPKYFYGMDTAKEVVSNISKEKDRRLKYAQRKNQRYFYGNHIYLFIDSFYEIQKKQNSPIGEFLVKLLASSRQTNIHTIVFDSPEIFVSTQTGFFSNIAFLNGCYLKKYKECVSNPKAIIGMKSGEYFFDDGANSKLTRIYQI